LLSINVRMDKEIVLGDSRKLVKEDCENS
jgi:hypothetical protein